MINGALALNGPITQVMAEIQTVHKTRDGQAVTNDDHAQIMCRFENGAMGHLFFSRVAHGRKMGYGYEIHGTTGSIRFDGEDQNSIWLYKNQGPDAQKGFVRILTGPEHPDYLPFCQGPGHGTGYQDQIIIEAKDFLTAIADGKNHWPTFADGLEVSKIVEAAFASQDAKTWVPVTPA
jgi:predicted dehydrogenase